MDIKALNTTTTVFKDATTFKIIEALNDAVKPAAINLKTFAKNHFTGDKKAYLKEIVKFLRDRVSYKKDNFIYQDIKFPGRLLQEKNGDCKSFSLFAAGALSAAGIENGFRFVSYRPGDPTHVYNFYIDDKGKKIYFDLCTPTLKQTKFLNNIDMDVRYLAGPEIGRRSKAQRQEKRAERRENRQQKREDRKETRQQKREDRKAMSPAERRAKRKEGRGEKKRPFKRFALGPARLAFLELTKLNFRDLANKLYKVDKKTPGSAKAFWNRLGGDFNKLSNAMKIGATRRAFLGDPEEFKPIIKNGQIIKHLYLPTPKQATTGGRQVKNNIYPYIPERFNIGAPPAPPVDPATLSALVVSAAAILKPLLEMLKKKGIKDNEKIEELADVQEAEALGPNFAATDPDNDPDARAASAGNGGGGSSVMDMIKENPIPAVAVAGGLIYMLTKK